LLATIWDQNRPRTQGGCRVRRPGGAAACRFINTSIVHFVLFLGLYEAQFEDVRETDNREPIGIAGELRAQFDEMTSSRWRITRPGGASFSNKWDTDSSNDLNNSSSGHLLRSQVASVTKQSQLLHELITNAAACGIVANTFQVSSCPIGSPIKNPACRPAESDGDSD